MYNEPSPEYFISIQRVDGQFRLTSTTFCSYFSLENSFLLQNAKFIIGIKKSRDHERDSSNCYCKANVTETPNLIKYSASFQIHSDYCLYPGCNTVGKFYRENKSTADNPATEETYLK